MPGPSDHTGPLGSPACVEAVAQGMCEAEAVEFKLSLEDATEKWTTECVMWRFRARAALAAVMPFVERAMRERGDV